jgi:hypothetical protein
VNTVKFLPVIVIATSALFITAMEDSYGYKQALLEHTEGLATLINEEAINDSDKIVVLPEKFRYEATKKAVEEGRLFVALDSKQNIVAYKKMFVPEDEELADILTNELRVSPFQEPAGSSNIALNENLSVHTESSKTIKNMLVSPATYIYTGADFTNINHRNKGINNGLTTYALRMLKSSVMENIKRKKSIHLAVMYGLTKSNVGNESDILDGRTRSIVKQFVPFAKEVAYEYSAFVPSTMLITRFSAFKPSFDPKSSECRPLSDDQSIPGYGYLVGCPLHKNNN